MTPTPEELLRLARKAFPGLYVFYVNEGGVFTDRGWFMELPPGKSLALPGQGACLQAIHAALLRLAGEADLSAMLEENAALLAERDRLRAGIADTIEAMEAAKAAKSAPGNEAYDEGFNMACGFSKQLQIVLDDPKENR